MHSVQARPAGLPIPQCGNHSNSKQRGKSTPEPEEGAENCSEAQSWGLDLGLGVSDSRLGHHSLQEGVWGVGLKLGTGDGAGAADEASGSEWVDLDPPSLPPSLHPSISAVRPFPPFSLGVLLLLFPLLRANQVLIQSRSAYL